MVALMVYQEGRSMRGQIRDDLLWMNNSMHEDMDELSAVMTWC